MYPILFESTWLIIPSWHICFVLACCLGYMYSQFLRDNFCKELNPQLLSNVFIVSYISAYFGARALSILVQEDPKNILDFFSKLISLGALTFYGAVLSALFFTSLYLKGKKKTFLILDVAIPSLLVGLSIGRLGCFLNGDDYGILASSLTKIKNPWWAVSFPNHNPSHPRVPIQLIESFFAFSLVLILYFYQKKKHISQKKGNIGLLGILLYSFIRFFLEFLRGDRRGYILITSLSTSQSISLFLFSFSLGILLIRNIRRKEN